MKKHTSKLIAFLWTIVLFAACSRKDQLPEPPPQPRPPAGTEKASIRFATTIDPSGRPYHSSNLTAVVTIANDKQVEVVKEQTLILELDGSKITTALELPLGNYQLTKFRLVYGGVQTHFAAPIQGSVKAALSQKPLAINFTVSKTANADVLVDVLPVREGEKPGPYGYPSGAFDNGQSDAEPYLRVKLRTVMQVGAVVYDSIPASLQLSTWNHNGEMVTSYLSLKAGVNDVPILKSAARYRFHVLKWGTSSELILNRQDVVEDTVYTLSAAKAAKLLKGEMTYKLINGTYVPERKNEYLYSAGGKLIHINYFLKRADNSTYLAMRDEFDYSGAQVHTIRRYNNADSLIRTIKFSYSTEGKVSSIIQSENGRQTTASVAYFNYGAPQIKLSYTYSWQTLSSDYIMTFNGGNVKEDLSYSSNENSEIGTYGHDLQINPYIHMNWPNLSLSNTSKNNLNYQYKTYQYHYPSVEAYSFNYSYDGDGYPKELISGWRSFPSLAHAFTTKTVYVY